MRAGTIYSRTRDDDPSTGLSARLTPTGVDILVACSGRAHVAELDIAQAEELAIELLLAIRGRARREIRAAADSHAEGRGADVETREIRQRPRSRFGRGRYYR